VRKREEGGCWWIRSGPSSCETLVDIVHVLISLGLDAHRCVERDVCVLSWIDGFSMT